MNNIKEYFRYSDRLRRNVSIITGYLIVIFNISSGYLFISMLSYLFFGISDPGVVTMLLYLIPGTLAGAGFLKLNTGVMDYFLGGVEIEKYSYLRMILLISIAVYFIVLFFFIITTLTYLIEEKIF